METAQALVDKNRNTPHPEGRQAKFVTRRTDYEEACGLAVFQWLPGTFPDADRLGKKGVQGLPGTFVVTFCVYKKSPVGDKTSLKG